MKLKKKVVINGIKFYGSLLILAVVFFSFWLLLGDVLGVISLQ